MAKADITILIPVHNEEENIERALESVRMWAREIWVLSSSTDQTNRMSKELGAKVVEIQRDVEHPFRGVQVAINAAVDQVSTPWVFRLDADEVFTPELKSEVERVIHANQSIVAYGVPRMQYFWGGFLKGGDWSYDRLIRLFRTGSAHYSLQAHVHEQLTVNGPQGFLKSPLLHFSHPTLHVALQKFNAYTSSEISDLKLTNAQAVWKMFFRPGYVFLRWMIWNNGWRDGLRGIVAASFRGFYEFLLYSKYLEARFSDKR